MRLDTSGLEARVNGGLERARHRRLPAVLAQAEGQLRDIFGHASVGGLEGEEHAAHGPGVY